MKEIKELFEFLDKHDELVEIPILIKLRFDIPINPEHFLPYDLDLKFIEYSFSLPDNFEHHGFVDCEWSDLSNVGNNITIGGSLNISKTDVKELGKKLSIGKNLFINRTKIQRLPDDLHVHDYIYVDQYQYDQFVANYPKFNFKKLSS